MLPEILNALRCPLCAGPLAEVAAGSGRALRCPAGHSFDLARQGYVSLDTGSRPHAGDSGEMIAARAAFLAAGHYAFVTDALVAAAREAWSGGAGPARLVVDAGAGTGHHLAAVLDALPEAAGLALDVSKPALRRAARAHPRAAAALCDTWRGLPVADGAARLVLDVFAPRNGPEFRRVLGEGGALVVVTPAPEHLAALVDALGLLAVDPEKAERVEASLGERFVLQGEVLASRELALEHAEVRTLVGMGPSAWHADAAALAARIAALPEPVRVRAAVRVGTYRPR
ncbi:MULTISPECIES: putative RNA methyltransferase [Anaeromyxobacter]|uniref:putative RNA methyltransferase n=1 Tax=Anaeromyxobacter TaxID=161492 RepID=UPI001F582564|nr:MULTISPECIES: 23S rRNA methyltransferase [unclassified Anaeromyxobacter]